MTISGVVLKNEVGEREVGERLEIEVKTSKNCNLARILLSVKKVGERRSPRSPSTTPLLLMH